MTTSYRQLDDAQIVRTIEALRERITERFPESNLRQVCEQLLIVADEVRQCVAYLRRPNWTLRIIGGTAIVGLIALLIAVAGFTLGDALRAGGSQPMGVPDIIQTIEAAVNDVVFFAVAVFFLLTIETRVKRRRALAVLHQLRSLAHIVDMHQLTKDPERLMTKQEKVAGDTRTTGRNLGRYLDFCSELLSLTSKVAALLVQHFDDGAVLAGVTEIEELTTALSGKIWQKINILDRASAR